MSAISISPEERGGRSLRLGSREVHLTHLEKVYFPEIGLTKAALLQYYAAVAPVLLPHLRHRAMVMKRYPHGIAGPFFYMKRVPVPHPAWLATCTIEHKSGNVIDFPVAQDLASLLWLVNLGCIDLHPWYGRCDDVNRPDHLHFDLDPGEASWKDVVAAGFVLHEALERLRMPHVVKTSGSKGLHVYVPLVRGPTQKEVWSVAKALAFELAEAHPRLLTAEYRLANRPAKRVLVDYNQNAWGRTLASVYSVRPREAATVSTPVTWDELRDGAEVGDFHLGNVPERLRRRGDLWKPVLEKRGRFDLGSYL